MTFAVISGLLQQVESIPRMSDTACTENFVGESHSQEATLRVWE